MIIQNIKYIKAIMNITFSKYIYTLEKFYNSTDINFVSLMKKSIYQELTLSITPISKDYTSESITFFINVQKQHKSGLISLERMLVLTVSSCITELNDKATAVPICCLQLTNPRVVKGHYLIS